VKPAMTSPQNGHPHGHPNGAGSHRGNLGSGRLHSPGRPGARPPVAANGAARSHCGSANTLGGGSATLGSGHLANAPAVEPVSLGVTPPSVITPTADQFCVHLLAGQTKPIVSLCTVGDVLFTGSQDSTIMIWDMNNLQYIGTLPGHEGSVKCMTATLARKLLFSGSADKSIKVWSLESFSSTKTFLGHVGEVNALLLTEQSQQPMLVSGGEDHSIRVWDLTSMSLHVTLEHAHRGGVFVLKQLSAGTFLSGGRDHLIKAWSTLWQAQRTLSTPHLEAVCDLAIGTQTGRFFSSSRDRCIRKWDGQTLESNLQLTDAHSGHVTALALSPSERILFSGGRDGVVKVWDEDFNCKSVLRGHTAAITNLLMVGIHLFSASADCIVRVWRIDAFEQAAAAAH